MKELSPLNTPKGDLKITPHNEKKVTDGEAATLLQIDIRTTFNEVTVVKLFYLMEKGK